MDKDPPAPSADALAGLVDIPLPPMVGLWPQTWPARIAILALVVWLAATIWWLVHHHRANRYRRAALAELEGIIRNSQGREAWTVAALALLVRRTALAAFPRSEVAALSGEDWLSFLDRNYDGSGFTRGAGRALADGPYVASSVATGDAQDAAIGRSSRHVAHDERPARAEAASQGLLAALGMKRKITQHESDLVSLVRCWIRVHHG